MSSGELDEATVRYFDAAHDGPGWYWYSDDYPEDGVCGAFASSGDAADHAKASGYNPVVIERKAALL